jgi:hypothetical protein
VVGSHLADISGRCSKEIHARVEVLQFELEAAVLVLDADRHPTVVLGAVPTVTRAKAVLESIGLCQRAGRVAPVAHAFTRDDAEAQRGDATAAVGFVTDPQIPTDPGVTVVPRHRDALLPKLMVLLGVRQLVPLWHDVRHWQWRTPRSQVGLRADTTSAANCCQ